MMSYSMAATHQRVSGSVSFQAPTMGINDLDPWPAMEPQYCISMVNFYPSTASIVTRSGYKEWATGLEGTVRSLIPYYAVDGTSQLFAFTDTQLYDVTVPIQNPTPILAVGNGTVDSVQFATVSNTYLVAVNATDSGWLYNGTTWIPFIEVTDTPDAPGEIKGVNPATFDTVTSHKRRLWFTQEDTQTAWYLPPDAVAGEAKPFFLGSIFRRGGSIKYVTTWSMDAGEDLADRIVFASTHGEIAVYSGDDPDSATDWRLDAVYSVPAPTGMRSYAELGGDIILLTRSGLLPLSRVVSGEANAAIFEATVSKMINRTLNRVYQATNNAENWQIYNALSLQAIIVGIPAVGDRPAQQFVMNILTGAWSEFNLPASTMANYAGKIFFGESGTVYRYGEGVRQDGVAFDGTGGTPVQCSLFSAFSYLDDPGQLKHFKMVRPIFQGAQTPSYRIKVNVDFDTAALFGAPPNPPPNSGLYLWDSALWDSSFWASTTTVHRPWGGVKGLGYAAALLLQVSSTELVTFVAGQLIYEAGDGI